MVKQLSLAKLSQPKIFGVIERSRLFILLDEKRSHHSVIWISGPPGTGKTALVASYLEASKLPAIWYQVDSGDSDLATFFYYLGLAGKAAAGRKRLLLPLLTPEYLSDLSGFTRRFFRKLFSSVSSTSIWVLDNYQEVVPESDFHTIIEGAIAELPIGFNLIAISHSEPPLQLARQRANHLIGQIHWQDLRLTLTETKAIAVEAGLQNSDEKSLLSLYEQTNGWAAGLVLMMERLKETGAVNHIAQSETMESVFNYFAGQVFDQIPVDMREFLMRTSVLPHMTLRTATEIGGNSRTREWLTYLYHRRLFIDRRSGDEISYQYHALFRAFLLDRASIYFSSTEFKAIKQLGAILAEQLDEVQVAAELLAEVENWEALGELVGRYATTLLTQGRHQMLQRVIVTLPQSIVAGKPWLLYWRGVSSVLFDPRKAIIDFEHAYTRFQALDDRAGLFLTISAVIDAHFFKAASMTPVLPWAEKLQQHLIRCGGFPSIEIEAIIVANLQGLVFATPHHAILKELEQRVDYFLFADIEPRLRVAICITFSWLFLWQGNFRRVSYIIGEINFTVMHAQVPPMLSILWKAVEGNLAWCTARHQLATDKFSEGIELSRQAGLPLLGCMLWGVGAHNALSAGDAVAAAVCLDHAESLVNLQSKLEVAELRIIRSGVQLLQGNGRGACVTAKEAVELLEEVDAPFLIAAARIGLAQTLVETGDLESARHHLGRVIEYAGMLKSHLLEHQALLVEAYSWIKGGEESKTLHSLRKGLRVAADNDYLVLDPCWRPHVIASLFSLALQYEIEVTYVKSVIRRRAIKAESQEVEIWPWPIKIITLGHFEIRRDGNPVHASGKAQHKPLELLKCLCALGGRLVNQNQLIDVLWPDSEGDAGEQALRTTLHRLRKLLQHDQSIRLEDRHLSVDLGYVWVDCLAFDCFAHHSNMTDRVSLQRGLNLYLGHFLAGETASWALTLRSRLHAQYLIMVERLGAILEQDDDWSGAVDCYLRAIEIDPVAETIYCRLMNSYMRLGRHAEAASPPIFVDSLRH